MISGWCFRGRPGRAAFYGAAKLLKVDHSTVHPAGLPMSSSSSNGACSTGPPAASGRVRNPMRSASEHIRSDGTACAAALHEGVLSRTVETQTRTVRVATMEGLASGYLARRIQAIGLDEANIRMELFSNPHIVDLLKKKTDIFLEASLTPRLLRPGQRANR